ncbi:Cof-type HAD-IIB family hydrolase [Anaerostipes sp.]|uniref:Cof-type HAD-IIB family hydrolase n=1 Tax=Anaerostipes sp. TaxID=1872530 RepID=UPI0025C6F9E4|nr:Cof-type HAD-IIB family hydrolase [Anaerostipes sp.]MBS7009633.1 HAD family phosphatase [Anaerostipes sp.]
MKEQEIKLIAMDMDGTLLTSEKKVTKNTVEVLEKAMDKGIQIVPATGRSVNGLPKELTELKRLRYCILSNGARVYDMHRQTSIYENQFNTDQILRLLDTIKPYRAFRSIAKDGKVYCYKEELDRLESFHLGEYSEEMIRASRTPVEDLKEYIRREGGSSEKLTLFFEDQEERAKARKELTECGLYAVVASLKNNLEISLHSCNKGDALAHLMEHLNLKKENIMACGDAENDYQMIEAAGIGVVMENGSDEMKEIADYITEDHNSDGVAKAIEALVLK